MKYECEERVTLLEVDGRDMVCVSVSGLDGRGLLDTLGVAARLIRSRPKGSVRTLVDLIDPSFGKPFSVGDYDGNVIDGIKSYTVRNKPFVHAAAVVANGNEPNTDFVSFLREISGREFEFFESRDVALSWLARQ